jgi:hypothetical protein
MTTDDRIDRLTTTATNLQTSVNTLTRRMRVTRRRTVWIAFSVLLDFALTIALATVLSGQADTNRRVRESLAQNYTTAQQQAQTRIKVLCPLYTILLASATDPARAVAMTPAQRAQLAVSVKVVRSGYTALGCLPPMPG